VSKKPLNKKHVVACLHQLLLACGLDSTGYSGHSFRRGGATAASRVGIPGEEIKQLGRWSSNAFERYIEPHVSTKLANIQRLAAGFGVFGAGRLASGRDASPIFPQNPGFCTTPCFP
jgi:hypothetical protein